MNSPTYTAPTWKRVASSILDFFTVFTVAGNIIALFAGEKTPSGLALEGWLFKLEGSGFSLQGWSALLLFAAVVAYFFIGRRITGGTLWDWFFGIARPQANP